MYEGRGCDVRVVYLNRSLVQLFQFVKFFMVVRIAKHGFPASSIVKVLKLVLQTLI